MATKRLKKQENSSEDLCTFLLQSLWLNGGAYV